VTKSCIIFFKLLNWFWNFGLLQLVSEAKQDTTAKITQPLVLKTLASLSALSG